MLRGQMMMIGIVGNSPPGRPGMPGTTGAGREGVPGRGLGVGLGLGAPGCGGRGPGFCGPFRFPVRTPGFSWGCPG